MSEIRDERAMYEMALMIARVRVKGSQDHYREDATSAAFFQPGSPDLLEGVRIEDHDAMAFIGRKTYFPS